MNTCTILAGLLAAMTSLGLEAQDAPERLEVVATHPALGSIATQVGGDRVRVTSLCPPAGDVHAVDARPSLFARLTDADVFVHSGLDLELWVPDALKGSRNSRIQPGRAGHVDASEGIQLLDVPKDPSRKDGDVHVYGNPHYWMDPLNAKVIAGTLASALARLDPEGAGSYLENRKRFEDDLNQRLAGWLRKAIPFKDAPLIAYHDSFAYFTRRFGFQVVAFVEPKPRIPPTQAHLLEVIRIAEQRGVKAIVREPYHDRAATDFLAERTGVRVITWTTLPGGVEGSDTYQAMLERNLEALLRILE